MSATSSFEFLRCSDLFTPNSTRLAKCIGQGTNSLEPSLKTGMTSWGYSPSECSHVIPVPKQSVQTTTHESLSFPLFSLVGNRISGVPSELCDDDDEFMDHLIGKLIQQGKNGCDAILCPPGTSLPLGRQTDVDTPCKPCEEGTEAQYYGMFKCNSISKERKTLEELHRLIFTGKLSLPVCWVAC